MPLLFTSGRLILWYRGWIVIEVMVWRVVVVAFCYKAVLVFPVFLLFCDTVSDVHVRVPVVASCLVLKKRKKFVLPSPGEVINPYRAVRC